MTARLKTGLVVSALVSLTAVVCLAFVMAQTRSISAYAVLQHVRAARRRAGQIVGPGTFYVTNLSDRTIAMNASVIEIREGNNWRIYTNIVPWNLRRLGPFQSGYGDVEPPPGAAPWRVHVWVSSEARGIEVLLGYLRGYGDPRLWRLTASMFGWKFWKGPPVGGTTKYYVKHLELVSEEVDPNEKGR